MNRALLATLAVALLAGCPASSPKLAQLHVACGGKTLDSGTEPPDKGQACEAGQQLTLSFDNDGSYSYVAVFAVTRDNIVFLLPDSEQGDSVPIQQNGHGIALPGSWTVPPKTRDIMAIFSREPLHAKDLAQRTRDVTLGQLQNVGEIRVRMSREVGPID
ncbi:MAG: hypothetical protein JST54_18960 [Deltaproteobacteria bacterium]|nr:hypothetical protein [Deltaproteobacteria bacterium]